MAMNRVQFQPGLSMSKFQERFGTEASCVAALAKARWPLGFSCPRCGGLKATEFVRGHQALWQCRQCRTQTSVTAGTPMAETKLGLRVWFQAIYLITQAKNGISALELGRLLGVCYRSAWRMKHKLMAVMTDRESGRLLDGIVQVDDAYLGGERSGVANGQQWSNKVPFVAAVSTDEGRPIHVRLDCVSSFNQANLQAWAEIALAPEASVVSDGLSAFAGIARAGHSHTAIITGGGRPAKASLRWVNVILSNLKTALSGTHHALKFAKYAARYLGAHQYRFNRRFSMADMPKRLALALVSHGRLTEAMLRAETQR